MSYGLGGTALVPAPSTTPPLLDAKQAGALLNVPASWLLRQARRDAVPHIKLGHYTRFDRDELMRWAASNRHRGPTYAQ